MQDPASDKDSSVKYNSEYRAPPIGIGLIKQEASELIYKRRRLQRSGSADEVDRKRSDELHQNMQYQRVTASAPTPLLSHLQHPRAPDLPTSTSNHFRLSSPLSLGTAVQSFNDHHKLSDKNVVFSSPGLPLDGFRMPAIRLPPESFQARRSTVSQVKTEPSYSSSCMWNTASESQPQQVDRIKRHLMRSANMFTSSCNMGGIFEQIQREDLHNIDRDEFDQYINGAGRHHGGTTANLQGNHLIPPVQRDTDSDSTQSDVDQESDSSDTSNDFTDYDEANDRLASSVKRVNLQSSLQSKSKVPHHSNEMYTSVNGNAPIYDNFENTSPLISAVMKF